MLPSPVNPFNIPKVNYIHLLYSKQFHYHLFYNDISHFSPSIMRETKWMKWWWVAWILFTLQNICSTLTLTSMSMEQYEPSKSWRTVLFHCLIIKKLNLLLNRFPLSVSWYQFICFWPLSIWGLVGKPILIVYPS